MKYLTILIALFAASCASGPKCSEEINRLPMYGHQAKCAVQLEADKDFVNYCAKQFKDKKEASDHYVQRAWELLKRNELDSAMFKLNQAWLLDSINADVFLGFGSILGKQQKFNESIPLLERSAFLNPDNPKTWDNLATSYCNLYAQAPNPELLTKAISSLKKALSLDPVSTHALTQLALSYYYAGQKDSARVTLAKADSINPLAIKADVREMILNKD